MLKYKSLRHLATGGSLSLLLALMGASSFAEESNLQAQVYGKFDINGQLSDEGAGSFTEIRSNNSWIGTKGSYTLDDDLSVIYKLEWKVDITGESGSDNISARPQFVGLKSKTFGQISIGRDFTPVWAPGRALDLFNHYEGDIKALWKGENRLTDIVTYVSPRHNMFWVEAMYQADKSVDGDSSSSAGLYYGDRSLKKSSLYAGIASDFDVKGTDVTRIFARWAMGNAKFGAMYHIQEDTGASESEKGMLLNLSYRVVKKLDLKVQYQDLEDKSSINFGADYLMAKNLKLYLLYTQIDTNEPEDSTYIGAGIQYKWAYNF